MRKVGLAAAVIVVLLGVVGYGLAVYGPPEIRTAINKVVQLVVPQADPRAALDEQIRQLPPGYTASYKTATFDVVSDTLTVGGVAVHTPDGMDVSADEIAVIHPSKSFDADWAQAKANPAQFPPDKAVSLAGAISVSGAKLHVQKYDSSIASMRIEGVRLFPWALLHPGVPSYSEAMAKVLAAGPQPKPEDLEPVLRVQSSWLLGVGYDHYVAETVHVSGTTQAGTELVAIVYDVTKMEGMGMDRGVGVAGTGEGITASIGDKGVFAADRVGFGGINLRKPMTQVLENQTLTPEMLDGLALDKVEYVGMKFTPAGATAIPIGTLMISKIAFTGSVPVSGDVTFGGLKLARSQLIDPKTQEVYDKLGIESMTISFGLSYRWDLDKKRVTVSDLRYKVDELGALNVSVDLAEMTPSLAGAMGGQLAHAVARYDDSSGVERAFKIAAEEQQADPAAFRDQIIQMVGAQAQGMGDSPEITAAGKALVAFLQAPKNLTVELAPAQPVPFTTIDALKTMQPPEAAQLLGLKVTANQ
ncbi:MAG TPA: hypothetical protein VK433_03560 [Stellaceae bacterium]|nr:hypothetical protein [Stellaceae bacterium]